MKCVNSGYFTTETLVDDGSKSSPRLRKFWTNQKHVSKSFHIKGIALRVHLESYVMLLIGNYSLKLLHVDGMDTCCDQEGWIKRSVSENIQSNLKGGFLGLECGAQSVVATANLRWWWRADDDDDDNNGGGCGGWWRRVVMMGGWRCEVCGCGGGRGGDELEVAAVVASGGEDR
ncbi:hypothetical protein Tco_0905015, partial [Tanacetum coccineum]